MPILVMAKYIDVAGDTRTIPYAYDGIKGRRKFDYRLGLGIATLGGLSMAGYTAYKNRKRNKYDATKISRKTKFKTKPLQ